MSKFLKVLINCHGAALSDARAVIFAICKAFAQILFINVGLILIFECHLLLQNLEQKNI